MRTCPVNQLSGPEKWIKFAKQTSTKDKQTILERTYRLETSPRRFLRLHKRINEKLFRPSAQVPAISFSG